MILMRRLFLIFAAALLFAAPAGARQAGAPGLVSAADPRAADAGAQMLRNGGTATDAAIATMLALTVVEPQSSGIGGGGFLVLTDSSGQIATYDGRETAPAGADGAWFQRDGTAMPFAKARLSGLSVGVPGNLALAALAHREKGKLAWKALFAPAITLARDGFRITPRLFRFLTNYADAAALDEGGRKLFYDASGAPLPVGTMIRNPELADTLERIAKKGPNAFYRGKQAAALATKVASMTPRSGAMTPDDISSYRAKTREPVCGTYRVYRICGMGPPSSGATTVLAILKQLERFDLAALGAESPVAWHLFAESQRLAYADRDTFLADDDFVSVPVKGLINPDYLAGRGALISSEVTLANPRPGNPTGAAEVPAVGTGPEERGTSHFVAVDRAGNVATYTSTVEAPFGSGLMFGGFYLNNELTDFSFAPSRDGRPVANRVEGRKRPRSSMAPTLVFAPDGKLVLAVGAAGGATIPVQVARTIIGVVDWKLDVRFAVGLPMLFSPGDTVILEPGTALEAMAPALGQLGHDRIISKAMPLKTNAVQWDGVAWIGAADPRSEGAAIGE